MSVTAPPDELDGSELGTKEYWDTQYKLEVDNFKKHKNIGEVWFGEDSMNQVIRYIEASEEITETSSILDVGCGNGIFLIEMACSGYTDLTGVDYAADAVQLATMVANDRGADVIFQVADFMADPSSEEVPPCLSRTYHVCHDKGTYDAVSLSPDNPREQRLRYIECVRRLLRPTGLLLLTSCNWTQHELEAHFSPAFRLEHSIPTPTFSFGGHSGSMVTSVVFKRPD